MLFLHNNVKKNCKIGPIFACVNYACVAIVLG